MGQLPNRTRRHLERGTTGAPSSGPFALNRRTFLRALLAWSGASGLALEAPQIHAEQPLQDYELVLTILAILQPASSADIRTFVALLYRSVRARGLAVDPVPPSDERVETLLDIMARDDLILMVEQDLVPRYSLTYSGNGILSDDLRWLRDRTRLFLLRGPRVLIIDPSRERTDGGLGGESPSGDIRFGIEGVSRPATLELATPIPMTQIWTRFHAVFDTGPAVFSRDTLLEYLSFADLNQIHQASRSSGSGLSRPTTLPDRLTPDAIALCLGVSRTLLNSIQNKRRSHYRFFKVAKRTGGTRDIESPKIFLKVTQRFILDFLLSRIPLHDSVHAFVPNERRSSVTNAYVHLGQNYLANLDIENFFRSVHPRFVEQVFEQRLPVDRNAARLLRRLCTLSDAKNPLGFLPQGAPTSPMLSNLVLDPFDHRIAAECRKLGLNYTRYADDITISGPDRRSVHIAFLMVRKELAERSSSLRVNSKKSHIASARGRQKVTGVVVNEVGLPPRDLRRRVRALFQQASLDPAKHRQERARMRGYLSYFKSFPNYPQREIDHYESVLSMGR